MRLISALVSCVCSLFLFSDRAVGANDEPLETSVCGRIKEPLMAFMLQALAGDPDPKRLLTFANLEKVQFETTDGRKLGGFKLAAQGRSQPLGFVLVVQGNAMLAEHTLGYLDAFSQFGLDAFAYDFRGFGYSEGKARIKAIFADYEAIARKLSGDGYPKAFYYGASFGGIVILNLLMKSVRYDAAVIDSSPSTISDIGCPAVMDAVNNIPVDASKIAFITGGEDVNVKSDAQKAVAEKIAARNGRAHFVEGFAHPVFGIATNVDKNRLALIIEEFRRIGGMN